jgi:hypothetical protein
MLAERWASFGGRCAVSAAASVVALLLWWSWPAHWTRGGQTHVATDLRCARALAVL